MHKVTLNIEENLYQQIIQEQKKENNFWKERNIYSEYSVEQIITHILDSYFNLHSL